jgi:hypothetical protein
VSPSQPASQPHISFPAAAHRCRPPK